MQPESAGAVLTSEGGTFVIRDAQGTRLSPLNLPKEF